MLMLKQGQSKLLSDEFERQVERVVSSRYLEIAGLSDADFLASIEPLRAHIRERAARETKIEAGRIPLVLVVKHQQNAAAAAMALIAPNGKAGCTVIDADDLTRFTPIAGVQVPEAAAYLLLDVDTGKDMLNITPDQALTMIEARQRSPLTIDEGIALLTHHPHILKQQNCFSLLGSRCGDRRVTALWLSAGRPKLGWCWAGNPHTWLGSASCAGRIGA